MTQEAVKKRGQTAREPNGRFKPGTAGGPGRPPAPFSVREMLRTELEQRPEAVRRIFDLCESEDENVAVRAILGLASFLDGSTKPSTEVNVNIDKAVIYRGGPELGVGTDE